MTCNLVTLLPCSYLVTLKVGTIYVPIHDVRTAIAVLNVALKTYARHWDTLFQECIWNLKNIILGIRTRTHLEVVNKLEHSGPLIRTCKLGNGISRFPGVLSTQFFVCSSVSVGTDVWETVFKIVTKCWICITRGLPNFPQFFIVSLTLHKWNSSVVQGQGQGHLF